MAQYADCCNLKSSGASVIGKENGWWVIPGIWQIIECVYFHLIHLSFCSPICLLILGWLDGQAMQCNVKIILHRIISVVWLTNFLSEIMNQSTHDDELNNFLWAWRGGRALSRDLSHWWSLTLPSGEWRRMLLSEWWFYSFIRDLSH